MPRTQVSFHPSALLTLAAVVVVATLAVSSNGGAWFYIGDITASILVILALAAVLNPRPRPFR